METSLVEIIKLAFLIGTPVCTLAFHLFRKMENRQEKIEVRIEAQESKMTELEKALIEIRTEFKFTSRDITSIKDMLEKITSK